MPVKEKKENKNPFPLINTKSKYIVIYSDTNYYEVISGNYVLYALSNNTIPNASHIYEIAADMIVKNSIVLEKTYGKL